METAHFVAQAQENTAALRVVLWCLFQMQHILAYRQNPHRAGHNVESVDNPIFSQKYISDSVNLNSDPELEESSHSGSSSPRDYSLTNDDIDLDSTTQIEEMCHVGTLAEGFSLTAFQKDVIVQCRNGNDTIVVQPTGSAKCVTNFRLSMQEKVKKLKERGMPCAFL